MSFPKIPESISSYIIETDKAVKMCSNFINNQYQQLKPPIEEDTRSVWFPIKVIEDYLHYIKQIGIENNVDIDGLRIFLGAYGDNGKESDSERNYSYRQTVLFMPTIPSSSPGNSEYSKHNAIFLNKKTGKVDTIDPTTPIDGIENQGSTLNRGHAQPPPPPYND